MKTRSSSSISASQFGSHEWLMKRESFSSHRAVDRHLAVQREEERVMALHGRVVVPLERLLLGDALAGVFGDARPFADAAERERPLALDRGPSDFEERSGRSSLHGLIV